MNGTQLIESCNGQWYDIFVALGVSEDFLDGKPHPCPACGGTDRFRFDDKDGEGTWFCNQCTPNQAGYGLQFVQHLFECTASEAFEKIKSVLPNIGSTPLLVAQVRPKKDPRIQLRRLWNNSSALSGSDPVSKYLHGRGLTLQPNNVRYCKNCFESTSGTYMAAMVSLIHNKNGKPISVHRTYACKNKKGKRVKKVMTGIELLQGSSIRLFQPGSKLCPSATLGVAEGIETAISVTQLYGMACWACISSTLMVSWVPPEETREVVIFVDNDSNYDGQSAAYLLAKKLYNKALIVTVRVEKTTISCRSSLIC